MQNAILMIKAVVCMACFFHNLCITIFQVLVINAKCHELYKHVHAWLLSNRSSVTKTHSQDLKHVYVHNSTATEH